MTAETIGLIDHIYERFYINIRKYLENKYNKVLAEEGSDLSLLADFTSFYEETSNNDKIRIRKRNLKLVDCVLMPGTNKPEDALDKKLIYRALSIQYTVLSALMFRAPFHSNLENIGDFLTDPKYRNLRS